MNIDINYVAVIVAAIASMLVGFVWYSPLLFGNQWMKLRDFTKESMKDAEKSMTSSYMISFTVSLITAYMLAHVMGLSQNFFNYSDMATAFTTAFSMWVAFVMPTQVSSTIFSDKKSWPLFGIDTAYQLVSLVVMAVVIALF